MTEARRKTTLTERNEIVEYCIAHNRNYKETASLYDVSYGQVYSWVKNYDTKTPSEVRRDVLSAKEPVQYPIAENKRIAAYKSKWCT